MKRHIGLIIVGLTMVVTPVQAQESAAQKPGGSLSQTLRVGQNVKVRNAEGETTRGRVLAVTDNQVALVTRRRTGFLWTLQDTKETFSADAMRTIDAVDSAWNGVVLGVLGGVAAVWWAGSTFCADCSNAFPFLMVGFPAIGAAIGQMIDLRVNKRIWDSPTPTRQVTILPVAEERRIGVMARVRF